MVYVPGAVSYTHLDVYKRQPLRTGSPANWRPFQPRDPLQSPWAKRGSRRNRSAPVSYTHLDVYKRQPLSRSLLQGAYKPGDTVLIDLNSDRNGLSFSTAPSGVEVDILPQESPSMAHSEEMS